MHAGPGTAPDRVVIASSPIAVSSGTTVYLKIQARGDKYDFSYSMNPDSWTSLLRGADGTILSTKRASGFVGATLGMYAYAVP
jgi:alpha-N-arabinofuranosidase